MLSLQFGELPVFRGVVGKLIVGEDRPGNNVRSHMKPSVGCVLLGYEPTWMLAEVRPAAPDCVKRETVLPYWLRFVNVIAASRSGAHITLTAGRFG